MGEASSHCGLLRDASFRVAASRARGAPRACCVDSGCKVKHLIERSNCSTSCSRRRRRQPRPHRRLPSRQCRYSPTRDTRRRSWTSSAAPRRCASASGAGRRRAPTPTTPASRSTPPASSSSRCSRSCEKRFDPVAKQSTPIKFAKLDFASSTFRPICTVHDEILKRSGKLYSVKFSSLIICKNHLVTACYAFRLRFT